jgi:diguanylate cyclase (GGDEF)-like protein
MNASQQNRAASAWFWVAALLFLAGIVYVVVSALTGADLLNARDDVPLIILGVANAVSLAGWWRDRTGLREAEEAGRSERERLEDELREREESLREAQRELDSARESEEKHRQEKQDAEARLKKSESDLGRERYLRMSSERSYQVERDWRQELHDEVMRLSRERGVLGNPQDVPSMVLRLTRTLVGAEKGLLLSKRDGGLGLIAAEGFEHDPADSAIVRRFAGEVLERDRTVREENPSGDSGADGEIENLVAIPIYLQDEFDSVVVCANNPEGFEEYADELLLAVGDHAGTTLQNARLKGELRVSYLSTVGVLAGAIAAKDPFLRGHSEEVSGYVAAVAETFELPPARREELVFGSLLHDIGKIGISERILLKPATLSPEERAVVELHPRIGYRLVHQVPALRPIAAAVLHHHERFDGNGYPSGLRGEQIPLEARIIGVADAFSAMVSERTYREPVNPDEACAELERCAGTQFDPGIVRVFVEEVRRNPPARQDQRPSVEDPELEVLREAGEPVLGQGPLATIDNLTMLYTRRHLHEVANAEAQRAVVQDRTFGVVLVELKGVSEVNRLRGYAAGDEEIRAAARTLQEIAARRGATPCRYGGSRLALVVPDIDEVSAELLAAETAAEIGRDSRAAAATWRPGETGDAVVSRARAGLSG